MSRRTNPTIYVTNESEGFLPDEAITSLIPAVQRQVTEHFQPVWGMGAQLVFAKNDVPSDAYQIAVFREAQDAADQGYLGYHFSPEGYPRASIFAKEDMAKDKTISDTLSHEVLEMIVDPTCNLYAYRPSAVGRPERIYFYEVCDAVQCEHYKIDGVVVCNFVYPEWFEHNWAPRSRWFDHLHRIERPFQIRPGCYADVFEAKRGSMTIWGSNEVKDRGRHRFDTRKDRMSFDPGKAPQG